MDESCKTTGEVDEPSKAEGAVDEEPDAAECAPPVAITGSTAGNIDSSSPSSFMAFVWKVPRSHILTTLTNDKS